MKTKIITIFFILLPFFAYTQSLDKEIRYGLLTYTGKEIVVPHYQYLKQVSDSTYLVRLNGQYVVTNTLLTPIGDFYNDYDIIDKGFPAHYFAKAVQNDKVRNLFFDNIKKLGGSKYKSYYKLQYGLIAAVTKDNINGRIYGVIDSLGNVIIPPRYGGIGTYGQLITARDKKTGKEGVIDKHGKELLACIYDKISPRDDGSMYLEKDGKDGLMNEDGEIIVPFTSPLNFSFAIIGNNEIIELRNDNRKYGLLDMSGKVILPFEYDNLELNPGSQLLAVSKNDKLAFANGEGKIVTPFIYDHDVERIYARIVGGFGERDGLTFFIDSLGNELLSSKDDLTMYSGDPINGIYIEETDNKTYCNYYNTQGEPIKIKHFLPDSLYRTAVRKPTNNNLVGFLDGNNKLVIPYLYSDYRPISSDYYLSDSKYVPIGMLRVFDDGKCVVRKKNILGIEKAGVIDRYGKELIPIQYQDAEVYPFWDICALTKNNMIAIANVNSRQLLTKFKYTFVDTNYLKYGFLIVEDINEKQGIVNREGKEIIPCLYDGIDENEGSGSFMLRNEEKKYGLALAETGQTIIPCQYQNLYFLRDRTDRLVVTKNDGGIIYRGLLDSSTGKEILPFIYDEISKLKDNLLLVKKNDLFGIADTNGNEIVPCEYKEISIGLDNMLICSKEFAIKQ